MSQPPPPSANSQTRSPGVAAAAQPRSFASPTTSSVERRGERRAVVAAVSPSNPAVAAVSGQRGVVAPATTAASLRRSDTRGTDEDEQQIRKSPSLPRQPTMDGTARRTSTHSAKPPSDHHRAGKAAARSGSPPGGPPSAGSSVPTPLISVRSASLLRDQRQPPVRTTAPAPVHAAEKFDLGSSDEEFAGGGGQGGSSEPGEPPCLVSDKLVDDDAPEVPPPALTKSSSLRKSTEKPSKPQQQSPSSSVPKSSSSQSPARVPPAPPAGSRSPESNPADPPARAPSLHVTRSDSLKNKTAKPPLVTPSVDNISPTDVVNGKRSPPNGGPAAPSPSPPVEPVKSPLVDPAKAASSVSPPPPPPLPIEPVTAAVEPVASLSPSSEPLIKSSAEPLKSLAISPPGVGQSAVLTSIAGEQAPSKPPQSARALLMQLGAVTPKPTHRERPRTERTEKYILPERSRGAETDDKTKGTAEKDALRKLPAGDDFEPAIKPVASYLAGGGETQRQIGFAVGLQQDSTEITPLKTAVPVEGGAVAASLAGLGPLFGYSMTPPMVDDLVDKVQLTAFQVESGPKKRISGQPTTSHRELEQEMLNDFKYRILRLRDFMGVLKDKDEDRASIGFPLSVEEISPSLVKSPGGLGSAADLERYKQICGDLARGRLSPGFGIDKRILLKTDPITGEKIAAIENDAFTTVDPPAVVAGSPPPARLEATVVAQQLHACNPNVDLEWAEAVVAQLLGAQSMADRIASIVSRMEKMFKGQIANLEARTRAYEVYLDAGDGMLGLSRAIQEHSMKRTYVLENSDVIQEVANNCRELNALKHVLDWPIKTADNRDRDFGALKRRLEAAELESCKLTNEIMEIESVITSAATRYNQLMSMVFATMAMKGRQQTKA